MIICHQQHASLSGLKTASLFCKCEPPCWQINTRWTAVDRRNLTSMSSSGWTMTGQTGTGLKSPVWVAAASSANLKLVITPRCNCGGEKCELSFPQVILYLLSSPARPPNQSHHSYWNEKRHLCCKSWTTDCSHSHETSVWCRLGERGDGRR